MDARKPTARQRFVGHEQEAQVDYEIEVQDLRGRKRGLGRVALGALVACVLALVLRHLL